MPRSIRMRKSTEISIVSANCSWVMLRRSRMSRSRVPNRARSVTTWKGFQTAVSRSMITSTTERDYGYHNNRNAFVVSASSKGVAVSNQGRKHKTKIPESSSAERLGILGLALALFLCLCAGAVESAPIVNLSKEFRKAALKCVDASQRLYFAGRGMNPNTYDLIRLDAQKLLSDAKAEAETVDDKHVYKLLDALFSFSDLAANSPEHIDNWLHYTPSVEQCSFEVRVIIDPDSVDDSQRKAAAGRVGCLDALTAWNTLNRVVSQP
jgi:hypothetical protein